MIFTILDIAQVLRCAPCVWILVCLETRTGQQGGNEGVENQEMW